MMYCEKEALEGYVKGGFPEQRALDVALDALAQATCFDKSSEDARALARLAKKVLKKHAPEHVAEALALISRRNYAVEKSRQKHLADDFEALLQIDRGVALGLLARIAGAEHSAVYIMLAREDLAMFEEYFTHHHITDTLTFEQMHDGGRYWSDAVYLFDQEEVAALLAIPRFTALELRHDSPEQLPEDLSIMANLHTLTLHSGEATGVDIDALATLPALRHLSLRLCLTAFPDALTDFTQLETLDLGANELSTLPANLENLSNLKHLDLSSNAFTDWPEVLSKMTSLESLDLGGNWHFHQIPDAIGDLTSLKSLSLGAMYLESISPRLADLTQLETLHVTRHKCHDALFSSLPSLTNLKRLHVGDMECGGAFPPIAMLTSLEHVTFDALENTGSELTGLSALKALRELSLRSCSSQTFPMEVLGCESLEVLEIHGCGLDALPEGISKLERLRELDVYNSSIQELPSDFTKLAALEVADLSMSSLERLPEDIGDMKRLRRLILTWSQLEELPDSITELESLEYLSVARNGAFSTFPDGFEELENLTFVSAYWCDMNPLRAHLKELKPKMKWCKFDTVP